MSESNQEGYQTLGWIINKSEYGLFLVIADEEMQNEIARVYRRGMVRIYDYKEHPKAYSFLDLKKWIENFLEIQTFLIINFQFAIQSEDDLKRLNFSRDMMAGLGKNLIFCTTPYGDDMLASGAYDFYSFIKMRIFFQNYVVNKENRDLEADFLQGSFSQEEEWDSEEAKKKLKEMNTLLREGREAEEKQEYHKRELILLEAMEIGKKILGSEHLEIAIIYNDLAGLYESQGKYKEAEGLYKKATFI
ncbi:MAG: tetratricopeptide repeat protein, partial [Lachnospiraceae bacterium]|nr:tetratricopeptide repeat protein [Lachnospiraceae bacterium]